MGIHYVTQEGYDALKAELASLIAQRPAMANAIAEAREKGDLSENSEYDAAKDAQGLLELKISKAEDLLANARVISEDKIGTDKVQILNKVTIRNLGNKATMTYTLVGETEADFKAGKLAITTPIARALLGHAKGDIVDVQVPAGVIRFEIVDISV